MGQKVSPIGFRVGVYRGWDARWYADKEYAKLLHEDLAMRRLIRSRLRNASVSRVETERSANQLTVVVRTAKPGIVIGKQGAAVDSLRDELERMSGKRVRISIHEIKTPELDATLVAENVATQLEKRIAFRRAMKQAIMRSMRAGALGVKIAVAGRLGGSEMSRREWEMDGRVPLHTLRANIDYGKAEAHTTFGKIGVTCWLYVGDFVTATGEAITGLESKAAVDLPEPEAPAAPSAPAARVAPVAKAAPVVAEIEVVVEEVVEEPDVEVVEDITSGATEDDGTTPENAKIKKVTASRPAAKRKAATPKTQAAPKAATPSTRRKTTVKKDAEDEEE